MKNLEVCLSIPIGFQWPFQVDQTHGLTSAVKLRYSHPPENVHYKISPMLPAIGFPPFDRRLLYGISTKTLDKVIPDYSVSFLTGYWNFEVPAGRFHIVHDINSFRRYPVPTVYETDLSPIDYFHYYRAIPIKRLVDIFLGKLVKFFDRSDRAYVAWGYGSVILLLQSGFPKDLIHIVPLPIESPQNLNESRGGHKILFIGSNFSDKGGPLALKAFDIVKKKIPDATLTVVSRMKPEALSDGVLCLGEVKNSVIKSKILPSSDILISPFQPYRPSYLSLLESIASGLPVVATYTPQSADHIIEGETGFLVRDYTPEAFAQTLVSVLENRSLLDFMSKKCVEFVKIRHNPELVGRKLREIYYKTIS